MPMVRWWPAILLSFVLSARVLAAEPPTMMPGAELPQAKTDQEYCDEVAASIDAAAQVRTRKVADIADLVQEGRAECAAGHIRNGLRLLRIALLMLNSG